MHIVISIHIAHCTYLARRTALIAMATGAETADRIKSLFGTGTQSLSPSGHVDFWRKSPRNQWDL